MLHRKPLCFVLCSLIILLAAPQYLRGQGFGTIVGTVQDPSGAVIPSAKVHLTDEGTGASREVLSDAEGYFVLPSVRPSEYELQANAPGFAAYSRTHITLHADESATVDVTLSVQQATQEVVVTAPPPQVDTSTATMSEVVDQRRVVDLPLNGRNAASLTLIVAGANDAPADDVNQGTTKTFPETVTVSTNGARPNQVSYRLDGGNNNDAYTNSNQPFPFPDALQEFSVQTSNYSSKYGGNAGGVVNVITKSGTNAIHGDGFEFVRNAVFNARNFFADTTDKLKRNQFGGTIGGPLWLPHVYSGKNRTFFFGGYQATRIRNVANSFNAVVPTDANLRGDFSSAPVPIIDPLTGQQFPNNQIPVGRLDPAALAFANRLLPRTTGDGRVFFSKPSAQNFDEYIARVDHSISDKDQIAGRYFLDQFQNQPYLAASNILTATNGSTINSHNALLSETHIFAADMVNEARIGFARLDSVRGPPPGTPSLGDLGINIYQPSGQKVIENVSVSGHFAATETDPAAFVRNQYNLSDDFTWVHGKQTLGFGVQAGRNQVILRNQYRTSGSFFFTPDVTGDALASFLLGKTRTFLQGFGEFKDNRTKSLGFYAQDDIRVSRRLTLNLGVRYDPAFPWQEARGRVEQFRVDAYNAGLTSRVYTNAPPGLLFPGDPGVPQYGVRGDFKDFSPRVGFAYDVMGDGKTSIRGGFGMFYDSQQNGIINNRFVDVTPFSTQLTLTNPKGPFSNPYLGISNPYPAPFPPPSNAVFPKPVAVVTYDPARNGEWVTPVIYDWNIAIERQLSADWMARVAYVGTHGSHLFENVELNPSVYTPGSDLSQDELRLFKGFASITQDSQDINSIYHSLQFTAQKRFSRGVTLLMNYTYSKSIDDFPAGEGLTTIDVGYNSPIPWYLPGRHQFDRGPSEFDHTHRFVLSYVWDLPSLNGTNSLLKYVVGGWELSGILTAQTGGPITVLAGSDQSLTGIGSDRALLTGQNVYGHGACGDVAPCVDYLNPNAFTLPALGAYGNIGKGAVRGPGLFTLDAGLFKEIPLYRERMKLQFRAEFFNVLNHTNLVNPDTSMLNDSTPPNVTDSGFGSITAAGDPRIGQLALKFIF